MNILRLPIFALLSLGVSLAGCDSDNEEVTATASESGGSSTGDMATSGGSSDASESVSATSGDSATATDPTATTGDTDTGDTETGDTGSSETGLLGACGEASSEPDCQDTESAQCAWFPSAYVALDNEMSCGDLGIVEGHCLEVDRSDGECSQNFLTTCEAGAVYYREAGLEVGAVELLVFNDESLCDFPDGFAPCQVNSEPKPGSEPSFFPPECACACE